MERTSNGELRRGWTTGTCAAAATKAAYLALLTGRFPDPVAIRLPGGERPTFDLVGRTLRADQAEAAVVSDGGEDAELTHSAAIRATVRRGEPGTGVIFIAGEGVGVVTWPGLPVAIGEPAINPGPRELIRSIVAALAHAHGDDGDLEVTISIPGGEILATRTGNRRLGIIGGLSILGTTGTLQPHTGAARIHAIHRAIDLAHASGLDQMILATCSRAGEAARVLAGLPDTAVIEVGDFIGGALRFVRRRPLARVIVAADAVAAARLACGHLNLHPERAALDPAALAALMRGRGFDEDVLERLQEAGSGVGVLEMAEALGLPLVEHLAARARLVAREAAGEGTALDVQVFDADGLLVGQSAG